LHFAHRRRDALGSAKQTESTSLQKFFQFLKKIAHKKAVFLNPPSPFRRGRGEVSISKRSHCEIIFEAIPRLPKPRAERGGVFHLRKPLLCPPLKWEENFPPLISGEGRGEVTAKKCCHCEIAFEANPSEAVFLLKVEDHFACDSFEVNLVMTNHFACNALG